MKPQNMLLGPLVAACLVIIFVSISVIFLVSESDLLREDAEFWKDRYDHQRMRREEALELAECWKGLYEEMAVIARTLIAESPTPRLRQMSEADRERFTRLPLFPRRFTDTAQPAVESK